MHTLHEKSRANAKNKGSLNSSIPGYTEIICDMYHQLKDIYSLFSNHTEKINKISKFSFIKFLQRAKLIKDDAEANSSEKFTRQQIEIMISANAPKTNDKKSINKSIDYEHFIRVLTQISQSIYKQNAESSLKLLLDNHLSTIDGDLEKEKKHNDKFLILIVDLMSNTEMESIRLTLKKIVSPIYYNYSDAKGYITFDAFSKFLIDFEVVPLLLSRTLAYRIFTLLSSMCSQNASNNAPLLDDELFSRSIFIIAIGVQFGKGISFKSKIAKLVDSLVHSKGSKCITKYSSISNRLFSQTDIDEIHRLCDDQVAYSPNMKDFMELISDN